MPTYMIFIREGAVTDAAAMAEYQAGNRAAPVPGMKALAAYGALEVLEGAGADGVVLLEFPDTASAQAWYHSPEYQARVKLRNKAAPYRALMVEGL